MTIHAPDGTTPDGEPVNSPSAEDWLVLSGDTRLLEISSSTNRRTHYASIDSLGYQRLSTGFRERRWGPERRVGFEEPQLVIVSKVQETSVGIIVDDLTYLKR